MAACSVQRIQRVSRECAQGLGYSRLWDEQLNTITCFVRGNDVFAILPTGYGKSLCYALLPGVFDRLEGKSHSIVVVITPLTAMGRVVRERRVLMIFILIFVGGSYVIKHSTGTSP